MGINSQEGVGDDTSVVSLGQRRNIYEFSWSEKKVCVNAGGNGDHIHFKATIIKKVCVHVQNGQQPGGQAVVALSFSASPRLSPSTVPLACFSVALTYFNRPDRDITAHTFGECLLKDFPGVALCCTNK